MADRAAQELLPPAWKVQPSLAGVLDWLLNPVHGKLMLPATGLLVLGLDWLLFAQEAATLGLATPLTAVVGFLAGSMGTFHLQRNFAGDTKPAALFKAIVAGFMVGVPFPLAGTLVGTWILATSGLAGWKSHLLKNRFFSN